MFSDKYLLELCLKDKANTERVKKNNKIKEEENRQLHESAVKEVRDLEFNKIRTEHAYRQFIKDAKKTLLAESMNYLMNISISDSCLNDVNQQAIRRNIINQFIEEQGASNILNNYKKNSYLLAEYARIIDKYYGIIIEKCDKNDPTTFCIEPEEKNNFFSELDIDDANEVAAQIKLRVGSAMEEFIANNNADRIDIKNILQTSQEKINSTTNENLKESYNIIAKREITKVRNNRKKNILESMIINISNAAYKNEDLKKIYVENNNLNMDYIVENCEIIYTFLETLNTAKIFNVNEKYLNELLNGLKA